MSYKLKYFKSFFIALSLITCFLGFMVGFALCANWAIEITNGYWWQSIVGIVMAFIFIGLSRIIPKVPMKDERLNAIEEEIYKIKNPV